MKKIPLITTIAAIVLVLAAGGIILKKRKAAAGNVALPALVPAVVDILQIERKPVTLTLPVLAEVTRDISAILASKLSARIMTVSKADGSAVKKGELVAIQEGARSLESIKTATDACSMGKCKELSPRKR